MKRKVVIPILCIFVVVFIAFSLIFKDFFLFSLQNEPDYDAPVFFLINERYDRLDYPEYFEMEYMEYYVDSDGNVVYEVGYSTRLNFRCDGEVANCDDYEVREYDINYIIEKDDLKMKDGDYVHITTHDCDLGDLLPVSTAAYYDIVQDYETHYVYTDEEISNIID